MDSVDNLKYLNSFVPPVNTRSHYKLYLDNYHTIFPEQHLCLEHDQGSIKPPIIVILIVTLIDM